MVPSDEPAEQETETEAAPAPAPKPKRPTVKKAAANGHAKPAGKPAAKVAAGKAPTKAKAASAAPKAKAKPKDKFGYRVGSLKSNAAAMYSDPKGATLEQVKKKLGSVQLNVLTELAAKGRKVKKVKEGGGEGERAHTRYFLK